MAEHENIKQLISVYFDGEATPEEQRTVEEHIQSCEACRKYFEELKKLSSSLQSWTDETLSPDLIQNFNKKMREGQEMKTKSILIPVTSSVLVGLLVFMVATQVYVKRGIQGRLRAATEYLAGDIGEQQSAGKTEVRTAYGSKSQPNVGWKDVASISGKEASKISNQDIYNLDYEYWGDSGSYGTKSKGGINQYEPYYLSSNYQVEKKDKTQTTTVEASRARQAGGYQKSGFDATKWQAGAGFDEGYVGDASSVALKGPSASAARVLASETISDSAASVRYGWSDEKRAFVVEGVDGKGYATKGVVSPEVEYWADQQKQEEFNTEQYDRIYENEFMEVAENPLSTFSIDVDTASYSNIRRFLSNNQLPPKDAVRIEEMVNYFVYDYPQPTGEDPFSINTEVAAAPWNNNHGLVMIGLQGKALSAEEIPPSNLVFLIDVSGSMKSANKLPLLKQAFRMLAQQLRPEEKISIVTYAGAAGLVLDSASGAEKQKILSALDNLEAGGCTAGGAGIKLAYSVARKNFIPGGNKILPWFVF